VRAPIIQDGRDATVQADEDLCAVLVRVVAANSTWWDPRDGEDPTDRDTQTLTTHVRDDRERAILDMLPEPQLDQRADGGVLHGR